MMNSILGSVKKNIGLREEDTSFDEDIVLHINSVFGILNQMGVGPKEPFQISGPYEVWSDFLEDNNKIPFVKSYIEKKVKLMFDPPLSSAVAQAMNEIVKELEWRLYSEENYHKNKE